MRFFKWLGRVFQKSQVHGPIVVGTAQVLEQNGVIPSGTVADTVQSAGLIYTILMRFRPNAGQPITQAQEDSR